MCVCVCVRVSVQTTLCPHLPARSPRHAPRHLDLPALHSPPLTFSYGVSPVPRQNAAVPRLWVPYHQRFVLCFHCLPFSFPRRAVAGAVLSIIAFLAPRRVRARSPLNKWVNTWGAVQPAAGRTDPHKPLKLVALLVQRRERTCFRCRFPELQGWWHSPSTQGGRARPGEMGFNTDLCGGARCRSAYGKWGKKARDLEGVSEETKSTVRESK